MKHPASILVVSGTSNQEGLGALLSANGYHAVFAETGLAALEVFETTPPDAMILGLRLPDMDSADVCRQIRRRSTAPIILLAARGRDAEKLAALEEGADDYVTLPFSAGDLLSSVRVAVHRVFHHADRRDVLRLPHLTIDFAQHRVVHGGHEVKLSCDEFGLLAYLARHADRVLTYHTILQANPAVHTPRHLWERIGHLRRKIETDPFRPRHLVSEPWIGYRFVNGH